VAATYRLILEVDHELDHADDFGASFVANKQFAEFFVAADLYHHVFCWSRCFTALDEADDCSELFFPILFGVRQVAD